MNDEITKYCKRFQKYFKNIPGSFWSISIDGAKSPYVLTVRSNDREECMSRVFNRLRDAKKEALRQVIIKEYKLEMAEKQKGISQSCIDILDMKSQKTSLVIKDLEDILKELKKNTVSKILNKKRIQSTYEEWFFYKGIERGLQKAKRAIREME